MADNLNILKIITESLVEKKGIDLVYIDFKSTEYSLCNFFVICSGTSAIHVETLGQFVEKNIQEKLSINTFSKEGYQNSQWVILDYIDVVVHIFQPFYRNFFKLEELWADANIHYYQKNELIFE